MAMPDVLFQALARELRLERSQGLDIEAHHILPSGWTLECRPDGYVFIGPRSHDWEDTVWRIVRFLAYTSLITLRESSVDDAVEYELVSCMEDGTGFRAVFRSRPVLLATGGLIDTGCDHASGG